MTKPLTSTSSHLRLNARLAIALALLSAYSICRPFIRQSSRTLESPRQLPTGQKRLHRNKAGSHGRKMRQSHSRAKQNHFPNAKESTLATYQKHRTRLASQIRAICSQYVPPLAHKAANDYSPSGFLTLPLLRPSCSSFCCCNKASKLSNSTEWATNSPIVRLHQPE